MFLVKSETQAVEYDKVILCSGSQAGMKNPKDYNGYDNETLIEMYPNCKRITTESFKNTDISSILGEKKNIQLEKLIVKSSGYYDEFEQLY